GTTVDEYLHLLTEHTARVMDEGCTGSYSQTLSAAIAISARRLVETDTTALTILYVCSMLAPEPVPTNWLTARTPFSDHDHNIMSTISIVDEPVSIRRSIARIGSYGLATISPDGVWLHRLTQAVLRDMLSVHDQTQIRRKAEAVLTANGPGDPDDPATWQQ